MKAIHRIFSALALAAFLLPVVSCQEKEVIKDQLSMPGNTGYESDYGSITFYWSPVEGAGQYQYILENSLNYPVAKGFTTATSATVKNLSPATTYTIRIKAIPAAADAETYAGSDYYEFEASTAAPKQYDFAWSHPATIYWDWSNQVHKSSKATFGYDKTQAPQPTYELGDVDHSGGVDIDDVTILINKVLGNSPENYFPEQANCNGDAEGMVDIDDVTALINRVLTGAW